LRYGRCTDSDSGLLATAQNQFQIGPHVYLLEMCQRTHSRASMYMWLCIHMHMTMPPHACGFISAWLCIHVHVAVYTHADWLDAMSQGPEFGNVQWATA
jgi:hypothetical protein